MAPLLIFYGFFLIGCGIASVWLIGPKAKTALASGGLSGSISLFLAYHVSNNFNWVSAVAMVLPLALFGVFAWRSARTLFKIFEMLKAESPLDELKKKGIAFLIISLMAVVSVFVFALLLVAFQNSGH